MQHLDDFIEFARKRHQIYLDRTAGLPRPWTDDPILQTYRFTNVFRELDATTIWYRKNVREVYDNTFDVFLATILFRWFNRVQTGEALFSQLQIGQPAEPVVAAYFRGEVGPGALREAIVQFCGKGPYVTGAYIITSPAGMSKLDGVLHCVETMRKRQEPWRNFFQRTFVMPRQRTLEETWGYLKEEMHMGPFMAYEVVTDLRHTYLLRNAPDIMTWCNPGPGAKRGIMRIHGHPITHRGEKILYSTKECIQKIAEILSVVNKHPLTTNNFWPQWEMRDVEHTLCEFDKYERVRTGLGKPRGRFG